MKPCLFSYECHHGMVLSAQETVDLFLSLPVTNFVANARCQIWNQTQTHGNFNGLSMTHMPLVLSPHVWYVASSEDWVI